MADPIPVKVTNTVDVKPAPGDAVPPLSEKTTETHEKTVVTGAPIQAPPPAIIADDKIRKELAREVLGSEFIVIMTVLFLLFFYGSGLSKDVLALASGLIGSILGYKARDTGTVIGYEFGSSSGSTAKSAALEAKN